jgi:hypothetical protein
LVGLFERFHDFRGALSVFLLRFPRVGCRSFETAQERILTSFL